jgi:hypothetical protein
MIILIREIKFQASKEPANTDSKLKARSKGNICAEKNSNLKQLLCYDVKQGKQTDRQRM